MDIFLSINNREDVIKLPVIPTEFKINSPFKNDVYDSISLGELKLIGLRGLKSISFSSFFPAKVQSFSHDTQYKGWEYAEKIEQWRDRRIPIRLIVTDTKINMAVTIDEFEYGYQDATGDVFYTMTLSEFKFINLEVRQV